MLYACCTRTLRRVVCLIHHKNQQKSTLAAAALLLLLQSGAAAGRVEISMLFFLLRSCVWYHCAMGSDPSLVCAPPFTIVRFLQRFCGLMAGGVCALDALATGYGAAGFNIVCSRSRTHTRHIAFTHTHPSSSTPFVGSGSRNRARHARRSHNIGRFFSAQALQRFGGAQAAFGHFAIEFRTGIMMIIMKG